MHLNWKGYVLGELNNTVSEDRRKNYMTWEQGFVVFVLCWVVAVTGAQPKIFAGGGGGRTLKQYIIYVLF